MQKKSWRGERDGIRASRKRDLGHLCINSKGAAEGERERDHKGESPLVAGKQTRLCGLRGRLEKSEETRDWGELEKEKEHRVR